MCQHHIKRKTSMPSRVQQVPAQSTEAPPFSPPSIPLPFPSTSRGHASCCMCKRQGPKLVVVPVGVRHHIFITKEVIIPAGARCCPNHTFHVVNIMYKDIHWFTFSFPLWWNGKEIKLIVSQFILNLNNVLKICNQVKSCFFYILHQSIYFIVLHCMGINVFLKKSQEYW